MKKSVYEFNVPQRILFGFLCICLLTGTSFLINYKTQAEAKSSALPTAENNNSLKSFKPKGENSPTVNVGERTSVWLKLEPGKSLDTTFYGKNSAISALQSNFAEPTSQVSADINADGYTDLISGFRNAAGGGLIALHRASKEAFEPTDKKVLADLRSGVFPAAFETDALILNVPTAPDFIVAGKFTQDSALDLIFAARGGSSIHIMSSDGEGGFNAAREIPLDGEITALAADNFDASKLYAGLVVALKNKKSSTLSVFDGTAEIVNTAPRQFQIEGEVSSLILANPGGAAQEKDVFGVADGEIFTMHGIGNQQTSINKIELPFRAVDIAVGEFIRDREARAEIAVLSEDGNIEYLTRGTLDTRPFTTEEVLETWRENGGRGRIASPTKAVTKTLTDEWSVAETHQLGVYSSGGNSSARTLQKAYMTGNETEDLLITDTPNDRVQILFKEPNTDKNRTSFTSETKLQSVDFAATPAAVLPMRLNVMGQEGFVFFSKGSLEPTTVIAAPSATFVVSKTPDTNDGACNADCSLREAVVAANGAAGADMITFAPNGTHQLTINNAGVENASAEGDLDITQALTIVGNGTANTILQAGTNTTNGIDKVLSVNPLFTSAFATSFTGFTVRFGLNPSTFLLDGFGGGFDWEGSGTGTLTISNLTVTDNSTIDGDGGGITATSAAGNSFISVTNSTISNNDPDRTGSASPVGGGIFVGTNTTFRLTTTTISNNNVNETFNSGQGGGLYAFGPANSGAGKSFLTGSTVSGNAAPSDGGGILSTQPIDFNSPTTISNNSSGRSGGGIFVNHSNGTTVISKATMTGNSAATNGGAIYLGTSTTANLLNMSFSRIVGNTAGTFNGLVTTGGTANVENNWWGCNTGPSAAPCNTAGTSGGGAVDFDPWLRYTHTASPASIVVGQTSTLTASFLTNSNNQAIAASNLDVLIGLPIAFNTPVRGTISGAQATIQASGTATATFTGTSVGAGSANAAVDNGTATANITIAQAATTTTITSDNPDPSNVGQAVTVTYTVTVNSPGAGTPTGNVTVSDGVNSCTGTVAAGSCAVTLNTPGSRTLTATYAGDTNFTGSTSAGVAHTVQISADLAITKTDGVTTVTAGGSTTYTITASNSGPSNATGATVTDTFPATLTATWTCVGAGGGTCTAAGAGNINQTVNLPSGGSVTFTASATISAAATGTLSNTATVTAPAGVTDPAPGNNSATDSDTILVATAAAVEVSGRVMTNKGRGISGARVTITDSSGNNLSAATSAFGYFRFADVPSGGTYVMGIKAKRYRFAQQVISPTGDLTDLNFVAHE